MIGWISVFVDVPADDFEPAVTFWSAALGGTASERRGDADQFLTIEPASGDAHLRMQCLDGGPRTHLDLHVDDVETMTRRALGLGAELVADVGYSILRSPGGYTFCVVPHHGESDRGAMPSVPVPHRFEMLCLDAPPDVFDAECRFWSALTDIECSTHPDFPEFAALSLWKRSLPWSVLVQQLGDDDGRAAVHAHLDISAGTGVDELVAHHAGLGAAIIRRLESWTIMRDPAGLHYCITDAEPR